MRELFWALVGFVLEIAWDKYKDWRSFETLIQWVADELQEIKNSLEFRFAHLSDPLKEKLKVAQEGKAHLDPSELAAINLNVMKPYNTDAWRTFIANGYASKLEEDVYKILRGAYTTLEGTNFIAGLATFQLVGSSSSVFDEPTRKALFQSLMGAPLSPIAFALPEVNAALKKLVETKTKSSALRSFARLVLK
jgi:hypothetical protein